MQEPNVTYFSQILAARETPLLWVKASKGCHKWTNCCLAKPSSRQDWVEGEAQMITWFLQLGSRTKQRTWAQVTWRPRPRLSSTSHSLPPGLVPIKPSISKWIFICVPAHTVHWKVEKGRLDLGYLPYHNASTFFLFCLHQNSTFDFFINIFKCPLVFP